MSQRPPPHQLGDVPRAQGAAAPGLRYLQGSGKMGEGISGGGPAKGEGETTLHKILTDLWVIVAGAVLLATLALWLTRGVPAGGVVWL